ncbi:DUF4065 domain-containing protein [Variovorax sp. LjRoot290]|uniref:Panacea domain-containing protein n=1 Tax=Variovorax sp. LjRoot290 TaxID=3342316 RepID=UPI003ECEBB78
MASEQHIADIPRMTGHDLAHLVLSTCGPMPHLKLQKLLFYVDAWHSVFFDVPLVEEPFEAWVHGPVLRSVWSEFRDVSVLNNDIPAERIDRKLAERTKGSITADQLEFLGDLLEEYGGHTAYHLENLTHSEAPWIEARGGTPPYEASNARISKETTRRYYASRISSR